MPEAGQDSSDSIAAIVRGALASAADRPSGSFSGPGGQRRTIGGVDAIAESAPGLEGSPLAPSDPFDRLFSSDVGRSAHDIVGNEEQTLDIIQTLSVDLMLEAVRLAPARRGGRHFTLDEDMRALFVPAKDGLPPTLLILDPLLGAGQARRITEEILINADVLTDYASHAGPAGAEQQVRDLLLSDTEHVRTALRIAQPEVVVARRPRMERLSIPSPIRCIETTSEKSTAGIYCRDSQGVVGLTACFHGTGPVGTRVTIDGLEAEVALASEIQDLVFIPLPSGVVANVKPGIAGILRDRTPSHYDSARFEGMTSGAVATSISSHDAGLLRDRPTLQLKVQTPADTNKGDSGSALIDRDGNVIGFAFEKSAFGETPQITDWIWAANALRALNLQPL